VSESKRTVTRKFALSFVAILLPILLYSIFRFAIGTLVPTLETAFSISNSGVGYLLSASLAATGVGTALSGFSSPRIGEQRTALLGLLIFSIPLAIGVILGSFGGFSVFFVLSGLGGGLMTTPTYSIAATLLPKRKGTAIGFVSASYNLGGFIGPSLCGSFLNYYGWQYPFLGMAAIGVVFSIIFAKGLSEYQSAQKSRPRTSNESVFTKIRAIAKNRNIVVVGISMLLADFAFLSYVSWTVNYLQSRFVLGKSGSVTLDLYFGIAVGIGGIGIIVAGMMNDKFGGKRTVLLSGTVATILTFLLYLSGTFPVAIAVLFAVGFFSNWFWGILSAMAQVNVPDDSRATAVSFVQSIAFIGAVLGPAVAGYLFGSVVTALPLILTVSVPFLVFTIVILLFYRERTFAEVSTLSRDPL
jgi:MFS family permease